VSLGKSSGAFGFACLFLCSFLLGKQKKGKIFSYNTNTKKDTESNLPAGRQGRLHHFYSTFK
jgi:hypothetical protein